LSCLYGARRAAGAAPVSCDRRQQGAAQRLDTQHPQAAGSLREGLSEMFTVNRMGLPVSLRRCLGTTDVIESPNGTVRQTIGRVRRWQNGAMVLRWAASAFLAAKRRFKKIMGPKELWMLQAHLDEKGKVATAKNEPVENRRKAGYPQLSRYEPSTMDGTIFWILGDMGNTEYVDAMRRPVSRLLGNQ
jgi:hypothetical protein